MSSRKEETVELQAVGFQAILHLKQKVYVYCCQETWAIFLQLWGIKKYDENQPSFLQFVLADYLTL